MAAKDLSDVYGEQYYEGYYERSPKWFTFFNHIADCLIEQFEPKTHLDAGCAWGLLVEVMRERGVQSFGVDFSTYALDQVHPDVQQFCRRASLAEAITGGPYDLVTCIEVLEHMQEADALQAIANLTSVTDSIVFSSTPFDFDDPTHINVQPVIYWLRAFAKYGFYPDAESDATFIAHHSFIVRKREQPETDNTLRMFAQIIDLRAEALKPQEPAPAPAPADDGGASRALDEIVASPAWKLISGYRAWLEALRRRRPGVFHVWERTAQLALSPLSDRTVQEEPELEVPASWDYAEWIARNEPSADELRAQVVLANDLRYRPCFSVVMPVYKIAPDILQAAIDSLRAQTYDNWQLCVSVIPNLNLAAAALLEELAAYDPRIRVRVLEANLGIAGNSNQAMELATGEFVALLDHDDTVAPFAFYEAAALLNEDPAANFIYSDRDEITEDGSIRVNPYFKPGWSPEILTSANYLTHLCILRTENVRALGGWRSETDGAQDWDLFVRATREYGGVRHIPKILYHWRHASSSVSSTGLAGKPFAREGQVRAIESLCRGAHLSQSVAFIGGSPKILWRLKDLPSVTIIVVPNAGAIEAKEAARQISRRAECADIEILYGATKASSTSSGAVKFVAVDADADSVTVANQLARSASGEVLVFVDAGVELGSRDWLREIVGPLMLPGVGLSGCHLATDSSGASPLIALSFDDEGDVREVRGEWTAPGFLLGWQDWLRNWCAASGACFAMRRSLWDEVGGVSAPNYHSRPDVRLCLKLAERGLRVTTNPAVLMRRTTTATLEAPRLAQTAEDRRVVRAAFPDGDPHINPNLHLKGGMAVPR